jgi:hypothetical protein
MEARIGYAGPVRREDVLMKLKYEPLEDYQKKERSSRRAVNLSFAEIETHDIDRRSAGPVPDPVSAGVCNANFRTKSEQISFQSMQIGVSLLGCLSSIRSMLRNARPPSSIFPLLGH